MVLYELFNFVQFVGHIRKENNTLFIYLYIQTMVLYRYMDTGFQGLKYGKNRYNFNYMLHINDNDIHILRVDI